jgi:hypothetical protein
MIDIGAEIDVGPPQRTQLAAPQAGVHRGRPERLVSVQRGEQYGGFDWVGDSIP